MSTEARDRMALTKEESDVFQRRLAMARQELETVDAEIERELEQVRERIAATPAKTPRPPEDVRCRVHHARHRQRSRRRKRHRSREKLTRYKPTATILLLPL